jgi:YggT family protein
VRATSELSRVTSFLVGFDAFVRVLQFGFFVAALVLACVLGIDWMVRTRRISPFSRVSRFFRQSVEPLMAPIERQIIRAGGVPSAAPWWALAGAVFGGIVVLSLLGFVRNQIEYAGTAMQFGGRGLARVLISWTFEVLRFAILVRVLSTWIRVSPYSPWVRWAYRLSEPILRPLRSIIPALGVIDVTPIIAYFALGLLQAFLIGLT